MVVLKPIRYYNGISGASIVSFSPDTAKYTVNFDYNQIETTVVTDKARIVDQWVKDINDLYPANESVIVGLNVERCGRKNRTVTLHLCVDSKIHDEYGGVSLGSVHADIKELAMQKWPDRWNQLGLEDLCSDLLGLSMKKPKLNLV
ncbi:hypothetical protein AHAS_Ahas13G0015600 [Arachis hypogaea]